MASSKGSAEDIAFLLYLVPIVAGIVYGAYEWYQVSPSSTTMPSLAYLIVSKSPYLFLLSIAAVCLAIIVEVRAMPVTERASIIQANATRLQILAVIVLVISYAAALSVASYDVVNAASLFIVGRYPLIYALGIALVSILLIPKQILGTAKASAYAEVLGLLLLAASPVILYGVIKVHIPFAFSALTAIVIAAIGAYLFLNNTKLFEKKGTKAAAKSKPTPQQTVAQHS